MQQKTKFKNKCDLCMKQMEIMRLYIQARAKVRYCISYVIYCDLAAQLGYISLIFSNHYEDNA